MANVVRFQDPPPALVLETLVKSNSMRCETRGSTHRPFMYLPTRKKLHSFFRSLTLLPSFTLLIELSPAVPPQVCLKDIEIMQGVLKECLQAGHVLPQQVIKRKLSTLSRYDIPSTLDPKTSKGPKKAAKKD